MVAHAAGAATLACAHASSCGSVDSSRRELAVLAGRAAELTLERPVEGELGRVANARADLRDRRQGVAQHPGRDDHAPVREVRQYRNADERREPARQGRAGDTDAPGEISELPGSADLGMRGGERASDPASLDRPRYVAMPGATKLFARWLFPSLARRG